LVNDWVDDSPLEENMSAGQIYLQGFSKGLLAGRFEDRLKKFDSWWGLI